MKPVDVLLFGFAADNVCAMYICHNSQQHEISRYNARRPHGFSIIINSRGYLHSADSTQNPPESKIPLKTLTTVTNRAGKFPHHHPDLGKSKGGSEPKKKTTGTEIG
jgi:hypothetical protein